MLLDGEGHCREPLGPHTLTELIIAELLIDNSRQRAFKSVFRRVRANPGMTAQFLITHKAFAGPRL
jgi:hypothetical protein